MEPEVKFPDKWSPPYELTRALPREIERTGSGTFMVAMALLFFAGAIPLFLLMWNNNVKATTEFAALAKDGGETTASITRLYKTDKNDETCMVNYSFNAGGLSASGKSRVPPATWDTLRSGDSLRVRYLPDNPKVNHPAGWDDKPGPFWVVLFAPAIVGACGLIFVFALRYQARFLERGTPAPGVVAKSSRSKSGYIARYQYRLADGTVGIGSNSMSRQPEIGEVITVLYNPQRPSRSLTYPASLYRVRTL